MSDSPRITGNKCPECGAAKEHCILTGAIGMQCTSCDWKVLTHYPACRTSALDYELHVNNNKELSNAQLKQIADIADDTVQTVKAQILNCEPVRFEASKSDVSVIVEILNRKKISHHLIPLNTKQRNYCQDFNE